MRGQSHVPSKTEDIAQLKEILQMTFQLRVRAVKRFYND